MTLGSTCQIDGEDFVNFCGLLRKYELYLDNVAYGWSLSRQPANHNLHGVIQQNFQRLLGHETVKYQVKIGPDRLQMPKTKQNKAWLNT